MLLPIKKKKRFLAVVLAHLRKHVTQMQLNCGRIAVRFTSNAPPKVMWYNLLHLLSLPAASSDAWCFSTWNYFLNKTKPKLTEAVPTQRNFSMAKRRKIKNSRRIYSHKTCSTLLYYFFCIAIRDTLMWLRSNWRCTHACDKIEGTLCDNEVSREIENQRRNVERSLSQACTQFRTTAHKHSFFFFF